MDHATDRFQSFAPNPRRTVSPSLHPLARQRGEGFLPASGARPARLATPRKFRFRNARRAMRAADVCFPLLLSTPCTRVSSVLDPSRSRMGSARLEGPECFTTLRPLRRVAFSSSTHRGAFSSPRTSRDRTSGTSVAAPALLLFEGSHSGVTETASARPPREGEPCSTIRSAFHHRGSVPSSRTPSRAPDLGSVLRTARDSFTRSRAASRLRFARASPWLAPFGGVLGSTRARSRPPRPRSV